MRYADIPQLTNCGYYAVDVALDDLERQIDRYVGDYALDLQPDFQRAHVWGEERQEKFVQFLLRGGHSSRDIYFNCPGWGRGVIGNFVIVDGKQRLEACLKFLRGELRVFGYLRREFTDRLSMMNTLKFHVNDLPTREAVLRWYLDLNEGGIAHTDRELDHVRDLLAQEMERS